MISLHSMFRNDFTDLSTDQEINYFAPEESASGTISFRLFSNFDHRVRYGAFFIPKGHYSASLAITLIDRVPQSIQEVDAAISTQLWHAAYDPIPGEQASELPFTGRIFMYIDDAVDFSDQQALAEYGFQSGLRLKFREQIYVDFMNDGTKPLAFVSHDSRDKDGFVRPLVDQLGVFMCPVWYDEYTLKPGDSLRESIDSGLSTAPRCILVLSPSFLANPGWTKGEFNAAVNRHFNSGGSVLIPIWHGVSRQDVAAYSSLVLDIKAVDSSVGVEGAARQIARVLKP